IEVLQGIGIKEEQIKRGIKNAYLSYRFTTFPQHDGVVVMDAAHNPAGFESLKENMEIYFPDQKADFIIGMMKDKDVESCIKIIAELANKIFVIQSSAERAMPATELLEIAGKYVKNVEIIRGDDEEFDTGDLVVLTGSFANFPPLSNAEISKYTVK
ncbi:glutamate ligase domain-containing protein, partial [Treponema sp. R6D11]